MYNYVFINLIKTFIVTKKKPFWFCVLVTTAVNDNREIGIDGTPDERPPENQRKNSDESSPTEVLETMMNLIVKMQIFKDDNEKLKKAQQQQQEINEVLLCSIVTKKIAKDDNNNE